MSTLFLDNHIWNYLIERNGYSEEQLSAARDRLTQGVQNGEWEVVCNLPVLQEIVGTYRNLPDKYPLIKELAFDTIQHRWLKDLNERYVAELFNGGLLSETGRYLPRDTRKQIERLANKMKDVIEVGDATHTEGQNYKTIMDDAKTKVYSDLGSSDGKAPDKIAQAYERWYAEDRDLPGWVKKTLDGGVDRKRFAASKLDGLIISYTTMPSCWQYIDFRHAKILLNLGYSRAIKPSDEIDAEIYGCSPYYDILVTDDKAFREAIGRIPTLGFELKSFAELMEMLSDE